MYRDPETGVVFHRGVLLRSPIALRLSQVVSFLFGILYALFATRFVLDYIQARPVGFVQAITRWTDFFYRPFRGIVANGQDAAGHPIVWSLLIAVAAYALLHAVIAKLLRMIARAHNEIGD
jgi:uncharacterized protein YggT (Ycf19 family)